jgi:hypothetical protein
VCERPVYAEEEGEGSVGVTLLEGLSRT